MATLAFADTLLTILTSRPKGHIYASEQASVLFETIKHHTQHDDPVLQTVSIDYVKYFLSWIYFTVCQNSNSRTI